MFKWFTAITLIGITNGYIINPGPVVQATEGAVWPKPQHQNSSDDFFIIRPHIFTFTVPIDIGCSNFLTEAVNRYWNIINANKSQKSKLLENKFRFNDNFVAYLDTLTIVLEGDCPDENVRPDFGDDEQYTININFEETTLSASSIWGILRGLETFSQLIYLKDDVFLINSTSIVDFPTFPHRGFLLDTSRHFMPLEIILQTLDALAYNKFNVFHWHITDDHSFPYKSRTFPELSDMGAYHPVSKVYQQNDVKMVIEYARLRGIRVIPEFDTPGHTRSWGVSHPELLADCYNSEGPTGDLGPMNPARNSTYEFIAKLFTEVVEVFPDSYFHIGGDEVGFECWENNPEISAFMNQLNITSFEQLEGYFIQKVVDLLDSLNTKHLVWEEVFNNGVNIPNSTIVHVWKTLSTITLNRVTGAGKFALFSSCWYLSDLLSGGDWQKFYRCHPRNFIGSEEQKKLVLGGEACMWGEYVNEFNVIQRVWPRASAIAEKLWSAENVTDINDAQRRLEEHACRMNRRGISAQPPNGPGVCL